MKNFGAVIVAMACVFVFASFAQADDQQGAMGEKKHEMGMMGSMMGDKMGKGMMMHAMMPKQIVASNDGGVIVLAGNKLYKYDKNLVLVKEAEIKVDTEAMRKMMEGMKANCPMTKHGEKSEKMGNSGGPEGGMEMGDMPMSEK